MTENQKWGLRSLESSRSPLSWSVLFQILWKLQPWYSQIRCPQESHTVIRTDCSNLHWMKNLHLLSASISLGIWLKLLFFPSCALTQIFVFLIFNFWHVIAIQRKVFYMCIYYNLIIFTSSLTLFNLILFHLICKRVNTCLWGGVIIQYVYILCLDKYQSNFSTSVMIDFVCRAFGIHSLSCLLSL